MEIPKTGGALNVNQGTDSASGQAMCPISICPIRNSFKAETRSTTSS